jgi:hypothetical protein
MQLYLLVFALLLTFLFLYPGFLLRKLSRQRARFETRERPNRQQDYHNRGNVPDDRC